VVESNEEAVPIARLLGADKERTVGWVYSWNTSELSVLWIDKSDTAAFIDRAICPEVLRRAKATTPEELIALLQALRTSVSKRIG